MTTTREAFTTENVTLKPVTVELQGPRNSIEQYRAEHYGVILTGTTVHQVSGRGLHNPAFPHQVEVWENKRACVEHGMSMFNHPDCTMGESFRDPNGNATDEPYTVILSAQSVCITAQPDPNRTPYGEGLAVGQQVELRVSGFPIGQYVIQTRSLRDPELRKVA